ncbi:MAG: helix-turn-helix domain-containing protein [Kiloniellales bacterium]|nr:helix-turn-helix domain-containing protein [Kiloniellales bacterium]
MAAATFTIGHLARETGCKVPTIRYYEKIGLLPPPDRSSGNQRRYGQPHVERLGFIRHCRELGFSQSAVRELLALTDRPEQSCAAVTAIAHTHLEDVNRRIDRLAALRSELERMIAACKGGRVGSCRIIETLADHAHGHCLVSDHRDPQ